MNTRTPLGVAVVGLGVGERHVRAFAGLPSCNVRAVFDIDIGRAEIVAKGFAGCGAVQSYSSLLNRSDIDVISIASFDDSHFEQVREALNAGKHVFVEKPLCRTDSELAEIRRLLSQAGGRLQLSTNMILRGAPLYRWLRDEIAAGAFGEIFAFDGDYLYGRLEKITEGWRGATENYSVMLGGGIHLIDLLLWLTNQRPYSVTAVGNGLSTKGTAFQYEDFVAATMVFPSTMVARISANFGGVHHHQHVLRIFGTRRTFILDDAGPRMFTTRDPLVSSAPVDLASEPDNKGVLIPEFIEAVEARNASPGAEYDTALFDAISIAAACDRAVKSGLLETIAYT